VIFQGAFKMVAWMQEKQVPMDVITYSALISACEKVSAIAMPILRSFVDCFSPWGV
jgi:hypothetical protein